MRMRKRTRNNGVSLTELTEFSLKWCFLIITQCRIFPMLCLVNCKTYTLGFRIKEFVMQSGLQTYLGNRENSHYWRSAFYHFFGLRANRRRGSRVSMSVCAQRTAHRAQSTQHSAHSTAHSAQRTGNGQKSVLYARACIMRACIMRMRGHNARAHNASWARGGVRGRGDRGIVRGEGARGIGGYCESLCGSMRRIESNPAAL